MWFCKLLFLTLLLKVVNSDTTNYINDTISRFTHEINNWIQGEETKEFQQLIHSFALPNSLLDDWHSFVDEKSDIVCIICRSILNIFIKYRKQGMSAEEIRSRLIQLCILLKLQKERICFGLITINLPTILHIIDSKPNLTASTICGVVLESNSCPLNNSEFNWAVNIDNNLPKLTNPENSKETLNIVQITDIHYDPDYEPYGNSFCGEPTCCRRGQNKTNISGKVAGFWGDYNLCDSPWHTIVDLLDQIRTQHQVRKNLFLCYRL